MLSVQDCKSHIGDNLDGMGVLDAIEMDITPTCFDKRKNLMSCERNTANVSIAKKFINESFLHANYSKTFHLNFTILGLKKRIINVK